MLIDTCAWNDRGAHAYMGEVPAAIAKYDIPASIKERLKSKMLLRQYDDVATITRQGIAGAHAYTNMRNMHFGKGDVCKTIDMSKWGKGDEEVGLIYCEEEFCIIVPTVCRNVSQIDKLPSKQALKQMPLQSGDTFENITDPSEATVDPVAFFIPENSEVQNEPVRLDFYPRYSHWHGTFGMGLSSGVVPAYSLPVTYAAVTPIPEPATSLLTLLGLGVLIGVWKWRSDKMCTLCGGTGHRASHCPWGKR